MENNHAGSATGFDLAKMSRDEVIKIMIKRDMLSQHGYRTLLNGDFISLNLDHLTALANAALARATPQHSVTEQASMPGDWQVEFDAYSAPGTIRLNSPKWGGCFLGAPKRGDIELPALVYHLLSDMLAQPLASTAATQPEQDAIALVVAQVRAEAKRVETVLRAENEHLRAALAIPASTAALDQRFIADLARSRTKYPATARMFDGLMGEVDELRRAYGGDVDRTAEAFDVAVVAYRIATEGDEGGNVSLASTAASEQQAGADERTLNILESCARWLSGHAQTVWARDFEHAGLMNQYSARLLEVRAALTHRATTATPGYKLVPLVPTKEMYDAARLAWCVTPSFDVEAIYKAMLAAAPDIATTAADQQGEQNSSSNISSTLGVTADQQGAAQPPQSDPKSPQSEGAAQAQAGASAEDAVVEANRKLLLDRSRVGIGKYGTTLAAAGLSRSQIAQHALEEALDFANYLQTIIQSERAAMAALATSGGGNG